MIKIRILLLCLVLWSISGFSQARIVLNDDAYIVLDNTSKIVVENPSPDAISTTGSGGNIISEAEMNQVIWMIGDHAGMYSVPFTTMTNKAKIPIDLTISTAGSNDGSLIFSTYETDDQNLPLPSALTNAGYTTLNNNTSAIDRFWIVESNGYTTEPEGSMTFHFDDATNELEGIDENSLLAQAFNPSTGDWEDVPVGTVNVSQNMISGIPFSNGNFFPVWAMVDMSSPLPVELVSFYISCGDGVTDVAWNTASELNNDYFEIEYSTDGQSYYAIKRVEGKGTTSESSAYMASFSNYSFGYFRLRQVDFDGTETIYPAKFHGDCSGLETPLSVYPNPARTLVNITFESQASESFVQVFRMDGGQVYSLSTDGISNQNLRLNVSDLESGFYFIRVKSGDLVQTARFVKE